VTQTGALMRTIVALALVAGVLAACDDDAGQTDIVPVDTSPNLRVNAPIFVGGQFRVTFSGPLQELRGGYLFVADPSGERLALLTQGGDSENPLGYELDSTRWEVLDYGVSGGDSTFRFPPGLPAGDYLLCTANSLDEACTTVTAVDAPPVDFCDVAAHVAQGDFDFSDTTSVAEFLDEPTLDDHGRRLLAAAIDDAQRQLANGGSYANDQMVDAVNVICGTNLTPVTMVS
jgi:hypothetical protein